MRVDLEETMSLFCLKKKQKSQCIRLKMLLAGISHDNSHSKVTTKQHICTML